MTNVSSGNMIGMLPRHLCIPEAGPARHQKAQQSTIPDLPARLANGDSFGIYQVLAYQYITSRIRSTVLHLHCRSKKHACQKDLSLQMCLS